jgi:epoxyqueuosine reductase
MSTVPHPELESRHCSPESLASAIKSRALELGFDFVGIAPALPAPHAEFFRRWLEFGRAGAMAYMSKDPERRINPSLVLPNAKSVISLAVSYYCGDPPQAGLDQGRIARYALGRDYHEVLQEPLRLLAEFIAKSTGGACKVYTDTGPILERDYAMLAGIGWIGKNTNLIHPRAGSWLFLAEIITDVHLPPDPPASEHCGRCNRCLDACPTKALLGPRDLDASRCISYLTIELKGPIPRDMRPLIGNWIFGCDICQEVCPFNRRPLRTRNRLFEPTSKEAAVPKLADILRLDEEGFRRQFRNSPIKRAKRQGLLRNAAVALGNSKDPQAVPVLAEAVQDKEPLVRAHAAWALGQIGGRAAENVLGQALRSETDPGVLEEIAFALGIKEESHVC